MKYNNYYNLKCQFPLNLKVKGIMKVMYNNIIVVYTV